MNVLPVSVSDYSGTKPQSFGDLFIAPAARKSIAKNIQSFYTGNKRLNTVFNDLEGIKINAHEHLNIVPSKSTKALNDVDIFLQNVHVDKKTKNIAYLYRTSGIGEGWSMIISKDSIVQNPVAVIKQILAQHNAAIHFKYNIPFKQ